jgi:hypothetical protein
MHMQDMQAIHCMLHARPQGVSIHVCILRPLCSWCTADTGFKPNCVLLLHLQVEHGITEMVNGHVDIVEWMLRLQLGTFLQPLDLHAEAQAIKRSGWSIEVKGGGARRGGARRRGEEASHTEGRGADGVLFTAVHRGTRIHTQRMVQ